MCFSNGARSRANLTVETDAHVMSVLFEGRRACGVRYRRAGAEVRAQAEAQALERVAELRGRLSAAEALERVAELRRSP